MVSSASSASKHRPDGQAAQRILKVVSASPGGTVLEPDPIGLAVVWNASSVLDCGIQYIGEREKPWPRRAFDIVVNDSGNGALRRGETWMRGEGCQPIPEQVWDVAMIVMQSNQKPERLNGAGVSSSGVLSAVPQQPKPATRDFIGAALERHARGEGLFHNRQDEVQRTVYPLVCRPLDVA